MPCSTILPETIEFLYPSQKKQQGILFHEKYQKQTAILLVALAVAIVVNWVVFSSTLILVFGGTLLFIGLLIEFVVKTRYGFTGKDAVIYYALQVYEHGDTESLEQLRLWNQNPFVFVNSYSYPYITGLLQEAQSHEDPAKYVQREIPDFLRLVERFEREEYQTVIDIDSIDPEILNQYYRDLISEINYTYKFGAYASTSILLRKLTENLMEDIMMSKGLYSELPRNSPFKDTVAVFIEHVIESRFDQEIVEQLDTSLNTWIRKKGNKGAHDLDEFTTEETEELMKHAKRTINLLIVLKTEQVTG